MKTSDFYSNTFIQYNIIDVKVSEQKSDIFTYFYVRRKIYIKIGENIGFFFRYFHIDDVILYYCQCENIGKKNRCFHLFWCCRTWKKSDIFTYFYVGRRKILNFNAHAIFTSCNIKIGENIEFLLGNFQIDYIILYFCHYENIGTKIRCFHLFLCCKT